MVFIPPTSLVARGAATLGGMQQADRSAGVDPDSLNQIAKDYFDSQVHAGVPEPQANAATKQHLMQQFGFPDINVDFAASPTTVENRGKEYQFPVGMTQEQMRSHINSINVQEDAGLLGGEGALAKMMFMNQAAGLNVPPQTTLPTTMGAGSVMGMTPQQVGATQQTIQQDKAQQEQIKQQQRQITAQQLESEKDRQQTIKLEHMKMKNEMTLKKMDQTFQDLQGDKNVKRNVDTRKGQNAADLEAELAHPDRPLKVEALKQGLAMNEISMESAKQEMELARKDYALRASAAGTSKAGVAIAKKVAMQESLLKWMAAGYGFDMAAQMAKDTYGEEVDPKLKESVPYLMSPILHQKYGENVYLIPKQQLIREGMRPEEADSIEQIGNAKKAALEYRGQLTSAQRLKSIADLQEADPDLTDEEAAAQVDYYSGGASGQQRYAPSFVPQISTGKNGTTVGRIIGYGPGMEPVYSQDTYNMKTRAGQ
jgi:hypothetical protein